MKTALKQILYFLIVSLVIAVFMPTVKGQTDLRIGLVTYYDEHTPNDNDLSFGNYSDVDDSLTNTGTTTATGIIGDGRQFNGSDSARMSASNSADFATMTTDATFCWWNYHTEASDLQTMISKGTGDTGGYEILWTNSRGECGASTCTCLLYPNVAYECTQSLSSVLNTWEFWCITKDTDGLIFWLDGVNETEQAQGQDFSTADTFYLGVQDAPNVRPYNGILDEIGLWNRTLNATEIGLLYNSGSGCNPVTSPSGCAISPTTQTPTVTNLINLSQTTSTVSLNWSGNGVEYAIYQDGSFIVNVTDTNYTVSSLTNGSSYSFNLTAYNSSYDISTSNFSNTILVTTLQTTQALDQETNQTTTLGFIYNKLVDIEEVLDMIPVVMIYIFVTVLAYFLLIKEYWLGVGMAFVSWGFDLVLVRYLYDLFISNSTLTGWKLQFTYIFGLLLAVWILTKFLAVFLVRARVKN